MFYLQKQFACQIDFLVFVIADDNNDRKSQRVLNELENIDDECDKLGIVFVKIDNEDEAKEYGIEKIPTLMYFEKGIPMIYEGIIQVIVLIFIIVLRALCFLMNSYLIQQILSFCLQSSR